MTFFAGDREKLERFRAGDRAVLAAVYSHYLEPLVRVLEQGFAVNVSGKATHVPGLRSRFDVECACHEVFLRAFAASARAAYDGERSYANYLYRIARNWRIDQSRRRIPSLGVSPIDGADVVDEAPDAVQTLEQAETATIVRNFLSLQSERDQAYWRHRYEDGLSQTAAAEKIGLTRIQGRRIELHLKVALAEALGAEPPEGTDE